MSERIAVLEPLAEQARAVSTWGNAEDFANQVMESYRLVNEAAIKHDKSFAHFGYGGGEINPWLPGGIDRRNKQHLIDFYNKVV